MTVVLRVVLLAACAAALAPPSSIRRLPLALASSPPASRTAAAQTSLRALRRETESSSSSSSDARNAAAKLLYLGAVVFPFTDIAVALAPQSVAANALAIYAAVIIAFIGGLQQAVAIVDELDAVLVFGGIGIAILGCLSAVAAGAGQRQNDSIWNPN